MEGTGRARSDPTSASYDIEREFTTLVSANPWPRVPLAPPYVLPEDAAAAKSFALTVLPGPWSGPALTARVLVLLNNPSYELGRDERDLEDPNLRVLYRSQSSGVAAFPWHLSRWGWSGAGEYWAPLLRQLVGDVGPSAVATGLATVQLVAYHSREFVAPAGVLPSQEFTVRVLRHALARAAVVVVARGWERWLALFPELADSPRPVLRLASPRRPYLTPRMMGQDAYEQVVTQLGGS